MVQPMATRTTMWGKLGSHRQPIGKNLDVGIAGVAVSPLPWSSGSQVMACHTRSSSVRQAFHNGRTRDIVSSASGTDGGREGLSSAESAGHKPLTTFPCSKSLSQPSFGWVLFVGRDCSVLLEIVKHRGGREGSPGDADSEGRVRGRNLFLLASVLCWVPLDKLVCPY